MKDLDDFSSREMDGFDLSKQAWTFGQIVSVLTLAAPLIGFIGTLEESKYLHS